MKLGTLVFFVALAACNNSQARPPANDSASQGTIRLERVGGRFQKPVYLTSPARDPRLFIVEQAGRVMIVKNGAALPAPFLDISARVKSGGEQGLLSMAFHPDYARNGFFFVNFTDIQGSTRVERFRVTGNPDIADAGSSTLVLGIGQPYSNHNGGHILFGPDGMLYIGMGDGGSGGDPQRNGQNRQSLLGKLLRLNVSGTAPHTIPQGNPYAGGSAGRPEIWATGLRNPWRFAFDRAAGNLYIADVGQNRQEEINVAPARQPGVNYGWNLMEGDECYRGGCNRDGLHVPQVTYGRDGGACSVTGGFVYRGRRIPAIAGHYFYSDYCAGFLRSFRFQNGAVTDRREWTIDDIGNVVSFGEDSAGELYIVAENGRVFRFAGN